MFHLEVSGPGKVSGTLILPPGDKTYLVHCDIAQHMEKGMKAQLKVGKGAEDLPSIPGVTTSVFPDDYSGKPYVAEEIPAEATTAPATDNTATPSTSSPAADTETDTGLSGTTIIGLAIGFLLAPSLAKKYKGMSPGEIVASIIETATGFISSAVKLISGLFKKPADKKATSTGK
jgi:hypothetical protein